MPSPTRIVVIGTGGTISARAAAAGANVRYDVGQIDVAALLGAQQGAAGVVLESLSLAAIDSKDMDFATWRRLAVAVSAALARADVHGVVVTHGTDTLEETAWFLHRIVVADKPVVLTGAMRPASSRLADGPQNLADAITVAASHGQAGVVAVLDGTIHSAHDVRKNHPYRLDAFSSGDAGALGHVEEGRIRALRPWPHAEALGVDVLPEATEAWPWVAVVTSGVGVDARGISALVDAGCAGLVVAATGNGTVHRDLEAALRDATRRGVAVVRSTRCLDGVIVEAEVASGSAEEIPALDLTPAKARVEQMLRLLAARRAAERR